MLLFYFIQFGNSQETQHKWDRFSGNWTFENSKAIENRGWGPDWNIYELINYNSIVTINSFENVSSININLELFDRLKTPSELMISFAVKSEYQKWFYHIYAFKITGGFWGMNKVSFIFSDRLDKNKPLSTKNNIFIKEIASTDCKIKYNKQNTYSIKFEEKNVVLYINDEKILSTPFPEKSYEGRIAISSRNVKLAIDKVEVKKNEKILFEDHFDKDSILVKRLKATKESIPETEADIKPE